MTRPRTELWRDDPRQRARLRALGATPRARLTWLLTEFLSADLSKATAAEWGTWKVLCAGYCQLGQIPWLPRAHHAERVVYVTRRSRAARTLLTAEDRKLLERAGPDVRIAVHTAAATPSDRADIAAAQRSLRGLLESVTSGHLHRVTLGCLEFFCRPVPAKESGRARALIQRFHGSLVAQVTLATVDYLKAVGVDRVRRCPYREEKPGAQECGQLFLAIRRQRYCSLEHTRRAMYQRWRQRGSPRGTGRPRIDRA